MIATHLTKLKIKCDLLWLAAPLPVKRASVLVPPCFSNPFRILSAHWLLFVPLSVLYTAASFVPEIFRDR
jgi:hypothetical protein